MRSPLEVKLVTCCRLCTGLRASATYETRCVITSVSRPQPMTTQEQGHQSRPKNRLREQRRRSRLSQDDVARLLGISVAAVSRHESGHHGLSRAFVIRYAKLFKVTAAELYVELVSDDEANNAASLDN